MPSFSLADLIPEPIVYIDDTFGGEGRRHDMRTTTMFSPEDFAVYLRLQREVAALVVLMADKEAAKNDPARVKRASAQTVKILDQLILTIMPDFPRERLEVIPTWAKQEIIKRWKVEQNGTDAPAVAEAQAVGEVQPPAVTQAKTPRGRRSPASASTTGGRR